MATTGLVSLTAPIDPKNGASKANTPPSDATVQYPPVAGSAAMPTMGLLSLRRPWTRGTAALPKVKIPPSEATVQYPVPSAPVRVGGGGDADHGLRQRAPPMDPSKGRPPKVKTPPSEATVQYDGHRRGRTVATAGATCVSRPGGGARGRREP